ncbi:MAG: DNA replication and repair protein RecF [Rikenellaceae bacterium]
MYLKHLSLLNFKNIAQAQFDFSSGINGLVGDNGAGKSNVLDAIYYLSMCKSMLQLTDGQSVLHGEDFFVADGSYKSRDKRIDVVSCTFSKQKSAGKIMKRNGKEYERLADHVGFVPIVVVSPYDSVLISDSAEERRRFINQLISQFDANYLNALIRYNALLLQRNKVLKSGADESMLALYDEQMMPYAKTLEKVRRESVEELLPLVCSYYEVLSGGRESVEISYKTQLSDEVSFVELMQQSRQRDIVNGFSSAGVHRDDLLFTIDDGKPLRKFGSQGQQKSFLVALKLAQYQLMSRVKGEHPILLLDDLFDKLDRGRVEQLIRLVSGDDFGQIFISDCNRERLQLVLDKADTKYSIFNIEKGAVV